MAEAGAAPAKRATATALIVAVTIAAGVAYLAWHLGRGWIPHDDGSLALSAERVMQGELPHRDFDDLYTGGLAYLDALAFALLGTTLISLRWELLAVFAAWIPATFYVARRFMPPLAAAGVVLCAVAWSVPNYAVPMPSWYNLFLATFGLAALLRHVDDPRARWLFAAGLCGGLSFLVKSIGLYYVAGAALFIVLRAHRIAAEGDTALHPRRAIVYPAVVSAFLAAFVVALALLVRASGGASELFHHVLPSAFLAAWLAREEWGSSARDTARFAALWRLAAPFAAGVLLPVALFLIPYAMSGSVGAFLHGVFVTPARRLGFATFPMPALWTVVAVAPVIALAVVTRGATVRARDAAVLAAAAAAVVFASGYYEGVYRFAWWSMRDLLPFIAVGTAWFLYDSAGRGPGEESLFGVVSVAAACSLVQFPFAIDIYFCYVAPLVILAAAALATRLRVSSVVLVILLSMYAGFGLVRLNTASIYFLGVRYAPYPEVRPLQAERARGILVEERHAYVDRIVTLLRAHGRGRYAWASPDSPHLYFLAGFSNPTRSIFEFLDDAPLDDAQTLRMLDEHAIAAVALNTSPQFSPPIRASLYRELAARYPSSEDVGPYQVRWR